MSFSPAIVRRACYGHCRPDEAASDREFAQYTLRPSVATRPDFLPWRGLTHTGAAGGLRQAYRPHDRSIHGNGAPAGGSAGQRFSHINSVNGLGSRQRSSANMGAA